MPQKKHTACCLRELRRWRGATQRRHTVPAVSSVEPSARRPIRLARRPIEKRYTLGHHLFQTPAGRCMERLAFGFEDRVLMSGIEHELVAIPGALMAGDLDGPIENTHRECGGPHGQ